MIELVFKIMYNKHNSVRWAAMKDNTKEKRFILKGIVLPVFALLAITAAVLGIYGSRLGADSEKRAYRLLADSARTQSISMNERVSACFEQLDLIASAIEWNKDIYTDKGVLDDLNILLRESRFANIAISTRSGKLLYQNGTTADCSDRPYFKDALAGRQSTQFLSEGRMSGSSVFVFASPVRSDNKIVGVIVATRLLSDICGELDGPDTNKNQYNFLCYGNGDVIAAADRNTLYVKVGRNIDDYFKGEDKAADTAEGDVRKYTYNDEKYYGIYMPIGLEDIYIFSVTTTAYASYLAGIQSKMTLAVTFLLFIITLIAAVLIIVIMHRRITIVSAFEAERRKKLEEYHSFQSRRLLERPGVLAMYYVNLAKNICCFGSSKLKDKTETLKTADDVCNRAYSEMHPCDRSKFNEMFSRNALLASFTDGKRNVSGDFMLYSPDERYIWVRITAELVRSPITDEAEAFIYAESISSEKRLEQICSKIIDEDFEAMGLIDVASGRIFGIKTLGDARFLENHVLKGGAMYDDAAIYSLERSLSKHDFEFLKDSITLENIKKHLENSPQYSLTTHLMNADNSSGGYYKVSYSYLDGRKESIVVSCENISDIVASKTDIETGLLNASGFHDEVLRIIEENPGRRYRIYRYNIDGLSNINATYGFNAGNRLLRSVGEHMRTRNRELSFSAHLYADHFARFCFEDYPSAEECYKSFTEDFKDYELDYPITIHMGVYDLCEENCDPSVMLYKAYLALRSVRYDFSTPIAYYKTGLMQAAETRQKLLGEVKGALKKGEFEVWFQPQYDYETSALIGAEALVRWRHPERGLIQPADFIPLLERSRQVTFVDTYVIEKSCAYAKYWQERGIELPISVNISRIDILSGKICRTISDTVKKLGIEPRLIKLEITESAYTSDTEALKSVVTDFKAAGFTVEMDDFGSGYSSLNILKDLDIDTIKIDIKLTSQVGCGNKKSDDILRSVVKMAKDLNIGVIAEGVETKTQAEFLKAVGCTAMQGYYFARPMPPQEFEQLVSKD